MQASYRKSHPAAFVTLFLLSLGLQAFRAGRAGIPGTISGTVLDPSGAVVPNATVEFKTQSATSTDQPSRIIREFYHPECSLQSVSHDGESGGIRPTAQDVQVRSVVPVSVNISLPVSGSTTSVTVTGCGRSGGERFHVPFGYRQEFVRKDSFGEFDVFREFFGYSFDAGNRRPIPTASSHGLGDHAENSFSVDGQPITDQQSKVFSNQIPLDSVQSMEVISGAPPAEYGGKTSVVIVATTRSGQGVTTPHGSVSTSYGSFGSSNLAVDLAYGDKNWGNFISVSGLNSGRFLDPPESPVFHDKGNEENLFDRVDIS